MKFIIRYNNNVFEAYNTMTDDGRTYIFNRCFDRTYTFIDTFQYTLINNVGFGGVFGTDTLLSRLWSTFPLTNNYLYDPTLELFDTGGVITGNSVDVVIPNDGVIAGLAIVGSIILSVTAFDAPQVVKRNDIINVAYNIEL